MLDALHLITKVIGWLLVLWVSFFTKKEPISRTKLLIPFPDQ